MAYVHDAGAWSCDPCATSQRYSLPSPAPDATKGFGKPLEKKSDEPVEKDAGTMTYEAQQRRGIPEYNIFMR